MPGLNPEEARRIEEIYRTSKNPEAQPGDIGREAEEVVIDFFHRNFQDVMDVRHATDDEDRGGSGQKQIIDVVLYKQGPPKKIPLAGIEVTTATQRAVRSEKIENIKKLPWIHLEEMKIGEFIPRLQLFVKARDIVTLQADPDPEHHPDISRAMLESVIASIKYLHATTRNEQRQLYLQDLLSLFVKKKQEIEQLKKANR